MILPAPPDRYNPAVERARNDEIEHADAQNRKRQTDVVVFPPERLILVAPDGSKWAVVVDTAGVLSTVPA